MSELNVANTISAWVENALSLPFTIYNDVMPDTDNAAACLRYDPAPAAERRYVDGTRLLKWNLTFYLRNDDREAARNYAMQITRALDGVEITDSATGTVISCEADTLPQFINIDEKNNTIYAAAIVCTYLEARA